MELKKLLIGIENFKSKGDMDIDIKKVECNSKKIVPNYFSIHPQPLLTSSSINIIISQK